MALNQTIPDTAKTAVQLCAVTYSQDPVNDIGTYLKGWSIVWNGTETTDGNYAFIALDPTGEYYALAIKGSLPPFDISWDAFANWILEDLDVVTRVAWPYAATSGALIASGTNRAFNNMLAMQDTLGSNESIFDYLQNNAVKGNKQVIITGHSLGGNAANVYASYFISALAKANIQFSNTSLFTFAAPAAGNGAFATDLDTKLPDAWHFENAEDIVPKFPAAVSAIKVAYLYNPGPSASAITVTYKGHTVSLKEGVLLLTGALFLYDYQQQADNYSIFSNPLDSSYAANTIGDWFDQAGAQHAVINYANYLGATLPASVPG